MSRQTRQREIIRAAFEATPRPLAPRELLDLAQAELPSISLATVYRTIRMLVDEGHLAEVNLPGESARYEAAGRAHHHHFHCQRCGKAFDLPLCPGDAIARMAPKGFRVTGHDITLFGECAACGKSGPQAPAPPDPHPAHPHTHDH